MHFPHFQEVFFQVAEMWNKLSAEKKWKSHTYNPADKFETINWCHTASTHWPILPGNSEQRWNRDRITVFSSISQSVSNCFIHFLQLLHVCTVHPEFFLAVHPYLSTKPLFSRRFMAPIRKCSKYGVFVADFLCNDLSLKKFTRPTK